MQVFFSINDELTSIGELGSWFLGCGLIKHERVASKWSELQPLVMAVKDREEGDREELWGRKTSRESEFVSFGATWPSLLVKISIIPHWSQPL